MERHLSSSSGIIISPRLLSFLLSSILSYPGVNAVSSTVRVSYPKWNLRNGTLNFLNQTFLSISFLPISVTCPADVMHHLIALQYLLAVQIMKLFIVLFYPSCCFNFVPFSARYLSQHLNIEHPWPVTKLHTNLTKDKIVLLYVIF